jgi:hypothetical protein
MAALRGCIGPRLTEKERKKSYFGLRPLCDPKEFEHADFTAQLVRELFVLHQTRFETMLDTPLTLKNLLPFQVLYFMVLFVYAVISPMTPIITGACFLFMGAMFRHQFIHIYPKHPDSGGKLWANFIEIMLSCMLIAQIT